MRNRILELIAGGHTAQALKEMLEYLPANHHERSDVVLLQSQYVTAKKNEILGLSDLASTTYNRINNSILDMSSAPIFADARSNATIIVHFEAQEPTPGNELALFNQMKEALEKMVKDREYPLPTLKSYVTTIDLLFCAPELVDIFEDFYKKKFKDLTGPQQQTQLREFTKNLLQAVEGYIPLIEDQVKMKEDDWSWKDAWAQCLSGPTLDRFHTASRLIAERLTNPLFNDTQRKTWEELDVKVNQILLDPLWRFQFNRLKPDLVTWINENLR